MSKRVYEDKWIKIRIDNFKRNGEEINYTVLERQDVSVIIPITPENKIVFVEEFRYPAGKNFIGLPMGFIDEAEDALTAAKRELKEETGIIADPVKIGYFHPAPGLTAQIVTVFKVNVNSVENLKSGKDEKYIEKILILSPDEIDKKIIKGEITDGFTLSSLEIFRLVSPQNKLN